jgi:hypothetical protein
MGRYEMPTPIKTDEDWLYPYGGNDYLERTQWNPIYSWGAGGWDLGSAPLVMVLFAKSAKTGYFGIQTYVEGDIHTEWYETIEERNAKCDEIAEWYWRHGGVQGPAMLDDWPEGELPEEYRGPFEWSRIPDTTNPPAEPPR